MLSEQRTLLCTGARFEPWHHMGRYYGNTEGSSTEVSLCLLCVRSPDYSWSEAGIVRSTFT